MKLLFWLSLLAMGSSCKSENTKSEEVTIKAESGGTKGPGATDSEGDDQGNVASGNVGPDSDSPMRRDLTRICEGEKLSGALELPLGDRASHAGIWLANNLESQESREFSASLRSLPISDRAARLRQELNKYSIAECGIIKRWADFEKNGE